MQTSQITAGEQRKLLCWEASAATLGSSQVEGSVYCVHLMTLRRIGVASSFAVISSRGGKCNSTDFAIAFLGAFV